MRTMIDSLYLIRYTSLRLTRSLDVFYDLLMLFLNFKRKGIY